jgi:hypothetical protein
MRTAVIRAALAALVILALSGTAIAAKKYVITSSKQIKPRTIQVKNLSKKARHKLRGATGPRGAAGATGATGAKGATGATGPIGPSDGYTDQFTTAVPLEEDQTNHTLLSVDVPAGSYIVHARLQGITVTDPDGPPGNNYRYDCVLGDTTGGTIENWIARVGMTADVESYLPYEGGTTLSTPGSIQLNCAAGNGHPLTAQSGSLTAIRVGALHAAP